MRIGLIVVIGRADDARRASRQLTPALMGVG